MPSRATQSLKVIKRKEPKTNGSYILISKKTGFMDVTINNTRYYYNNVQTYSKNTNNIYYKAVDAATPNAKKTIVIRRIG